MKTITRWTDGTTISQGETWQDAINAAPRNAWGGANLTGAILTGANLTGARLTDAILTDARLTDAILTRADLTRADLTGVDLTGVDLTSIGYAIPVVADLDARMLAAVEASPDALEMARWHTCETTHCRAGWAITLAGVAGRELEARIGSSAAGALIYVASTGRGQVPNWYASNEDALADIRRCAALVTT